MYRRVWKVKMNHKIFDDCTLASKCYVGTKELKDLIIIYLPFYHFMRVQSEGPMTLSIATFSITTFSITTLSIMTLSIIKIKHDT